MRKLLLATAAATFATIGGAGIAQAQTVTIPTLLPGTGPFGTTSPDPGTVVVRLGGRVQTYFGWFASSGDKATVPATNGVAGSVQSNGLNAGSYKEANYGLGNLIYLYPSVDGVAANGLQYGAFIELRDENYQGAGGGGLANGLGGGGSVSAADRSTFVYVRRSYGYLGAARFGTLRFGTTDGPVGLFETGDFESIGDGAWNGEGPNMFNANATPAFPWPSGQGFEYATNKLVYLSPQFYGFDFGLSYEPNTASANGYNGGNPFNISTSATGAVSLIGPASCGFASAGCDNLSSSTIAGSAGRRRNTIEAAGRYRGAFGPVAIAGDLGWVGSEHVESGAGVSTRYNGLNYGTFGATATVAGLTVGGNAMYGDFESGWGLKPVGAKSSFAGIAGALYAIGPVSFGASYFVFNDSGSSGPQASPYVGQYRSKGVAVGGTYSIAPGVSAYVQYLYGDQKENGVNLLGADAAIAGPGGTNLQHNVTTANGVFIGTNVRW